MINPKLAIRKCNYCTVRDTLNKEWCGLKCPIKSMVDVLDKSGLLEEEDKDIKSLDFEETCKMKNMELQ